MKQMTFADAEYASKERFLTDSIARFLLWPPARMLVPRSSFVIKPNIHA